MPHSQSATHIVPPIAQHTHTIIFLHGLSSNAAEFHSEFFESQSSTGLFFPQLLPSVKWIFPCAPFAYSSSENDGGRKWFAINSVQTPQDEPETQKPGLESSKNLLLEVMQQEARIVGMHNVVLAGISQGCATAIYTLLTANPRLEIGGFIGLCGWVPLASDVRGIAREEAWLEALKSVPVLLQHCVEDDVVPVENGECLKEVLVGLGMGVEWQCFKAGGELAHWVKEPEGVDGIVRFVEMIIDRRGEDQKDLAAGIDSSRFAKGRIRRPGEFE